LDFLANRRSNAPACGGLSKRGAHRFGVGQAFGADYRQRSCRRVIEADVERSSHHETVARIMLQNAADRQQSARLYVTNVASRLACVTPHRPPLKPRVGVRELHDQLSRYVQHAAGGGEVVVTKRGRAVARLVSIHADDALSDLRERGLVQEPRREWLPRGRERPRPSAPVSDLVAEQRR
jgi:prevent-host-death family protein